MSYLYTDITYVKGVGPKKAKLFNNQNIKTIYDLLRFYPKRYTFYHSCDIRTITDTTKLTVSCVVITPCVSIISKNNKDITTFSINTFNQNIKVICYNQPYLKNTLKIGKRISIYGIYNPFKNELVCNKVFFEEITHKIEVVYNFPGINDKSLQNIMFNAYSLCSHSDFLEMIPYSMLKERNLINEYVLYRYIHFPISHQEIIDASIKVKYNEFFKYFVKLNILSNRRIKVVKEKYDVDYDLINSFCKSLPFSLSQDQKIVINDVLKELASSKLVNRLIQGDVGSGKSIVALIISLAVCNFSKQVVVMAPTEILAKQHYDYFKSFLKDYDISIELLTSKTKRNDKIRILTNLANGELKIVIGTHALIENNVCFYNLGLAVIDEQHRFGVFQRNKLINKHKNVNSIFLSATPIPRTLGLTEFGDLDISSIKTLPSGKKTIITKVLTYEKMNDLFLEVKRIISLGQQVYVVVPLVNESDFFDEFYDIEKARKLFSSNIDANIEVIHGKLKSDEKQRVMKEFLQNRCNLLISTTIIEVGINCKNATMMVIFNSNRFGLSQLHQLRGRVGRNDLLSYCYLLSDNTNYKRLKIIENCSDGFELSEHDFKLRGPGDFFGVKQSGFMDLKYADMNKDYQIYLAAKEDCKKIVYDCLVNKVENKALNKYILENDLNDILN